MTRGFEIATMYEGPRPLRVVERPDFGGRPVVLAETSPRGFATSSSDPAPAKDITGPLALAAAVAVGGAPRQDKETRLVVVGDPTSSRTRGSVDKAIDFFLVLSPG